MIIDKLISREDAYASGVEAGFKAGLEAASEYHLNRASEWQRCITETHNLVDKSAMWPNIGNHQRYAKAIRSLKERNTSDATTDRDSGPSQEETSQKGPQDS